MRVAPLASIALAALLASCDVVPRRAFEANGLVATEPRANQADVDRAAPQRLWFERRIQPESLLGAELSLTSGERVAGLRARVDVLQAALVVVPSTPLDPYARWTLRASGLRDLDGQPCEDVEVSFRTGALATPEVAQPIDPMPALGLLAARCAGCHSGPRAAMGLVLDGPEGIERTALHIRARELGDVSSVDRPTVGLAGLSRIEPFAPERSYLVYKILGDSHVRNGPMPPPVDGGVALEPIEVEQIVEWIAAGAPLPTS
jgi:hypothetical protein